MRVDIGHILGPRSHMSFAFLVRLLLSVAMEVGDRWCGPFGLLFDILAIFGHVWNTISPKGKERTQKGVDFLVASDQG